MSTTPVTGRTAQDSLSKRDWRTIFVLLIAAFVVILNETIMNVALPSLMVELNVSANTVQWLSAAFLLTMAVVIPMTGWIMQRLAVRRTFALAMGLFSLGMAVVALASQDDNPWLLVCLVGAAAYAASLTYLRHRG